MSLIDAQRTKAMQIQRFDPISEPRVRLIEETPPAQLITTLVERILAEPDGHGWHRALALANLRSCNHDGLANGFLPHGLMALPGAARLAEQLNGLDRLLPFIQVAVYTNGAYRGGMRDPAYGVFRLPAAAPATAIPAAEAIAALPAAVEAGDATAADRLWQAATVDSDADTCTRLALSLGLPRVPANGHKIILPVQLRRVITAYAPDLPALLYRAAVRYAANPLDARRVVAAATTALAGVPTPETDIAPAAALDDLRRALAATPGAAAPELIAQAYQAGLSPETALAAAELAAADRFLDVTLMPGMDVIGPVHLMTTAAALVEAAPWLSLAERRLLPVYAAWNVDTDYARWRIARDGPWTARLPATPPHASQPEALAAMTAAIQAHDAIGAVNWARSALAAGDGRAIFEALAPIAARDNFTVLHAIKHWDACWQAWQRSRPEHRAVFALAAVKCAAVYAGIATKVADRARALWS